MSDMRQPNDPFRRDPVYDPNVRGSGSMWGWIAGAVFIVVVLAIVFGIGHPANQSGTSRVANNTPPVTQTAPVPAPAPGAPAGHAFTPAAPPTVPK
jgi:hypothetical protein